MTVMTHDGYNSFDKSHVRNDARMYLIIHAQRDHSIIFYVQMMDIINSWQHPKVFPGGPPPQY